MHLLEQATQPSRSQYPTCRSCGNPVPVFRACRVRKFCSRLCAATARRPPNPEPTEDEIRDGVRRIALTQGQFATVDESDYEYLNQWLWCALQMPTVKSFYAVRSTPRDPDTHKQKRITMAREILQAPPDMLVDHRNHSTLDNRRSNLRLSTPSQNGANTKNKAGSSSKYKGVSWSKKYRRWRAAIRCNGAILNIGSFQNEDDAGRAYKRKAVELFGEFASYTDAPEPESLVIRL